MTKAKAFATGSKTITQRFLPLKGEKHVEHANRTKTLQMKTNVSHLTVTHYKNPYQPYWGGFCVHLHLHNEKCHNYFTVYVKMCNISSLTFCAV